MATYRRIAGTGTTVGGATTGTAAPGDPTILDVFIIDTTPDADGSARKRITVSYTPPVTVGTFVGVWCYLDAPDTAGGLTLADGTVAADGTSGEAGIFEPYEVGFFPFNVDSPQLSFNFKAPSKSEEWRVYLVPGSERRHAAVIQAGTVGASVSKQFVCLPPAGAFTGRENAPLVTDVALVDPATLTWATNPLQVQGESGDQSFVVAVQWAWPTNDQNWQSMGGVNIVLDDGTTQVYIGNVDKGSSPIWQSQPMQLKPGTTNYTVDLISYDVKAVNNTLVDGITPFVTFSMVRQLGASGSEYAALALTDGVHAFVTATPVTGADGTALLQIVGYWTPPNDPQFAGAEIVAKKLDGNYYTVAQGRVFPIENQISNPASAQTWRFYLRSIDINGRRNSIVDNGDGTHNAGETPWVDISVGNALGQLNLGKALASSFATDLAVSSGQLTLGNVSATKVVTGILQVGGGGSKVSIMKNFDTLGSLIGWVGDDTGTSGFVGAWFKQLRIGGSSPSSAQITADASGNVTISGSLIVGAVASATSATTATSASAVPASGVTSGTFGGGVIYAGTINTSQLNAGTISVAVTMTSPTLVITSGGGGFRVDMNTTDCVKVTDTTGFSFYAQLLPGSVSLSDGTNTVQHGRTGSTYLVSSVQRINFNPSTGIQFKDTSGTTKVLIQQSSGAGYVQFNGGSNYAVSTSAISKKHTWGTATLSSGAVNVSTGLTSIESAVVTVVGSGNGTGTPSEYYSVGGSGGTLTIWSSNASSSQTVCWSAMGVL